MRSLMNAEISFPIHANFEGYNNSLSMPEQLLLWAFLLTWLRDDLLIIHQTFFQLGTLKGKNLNWNKNTMRKRWYSSSFLLIKFDSYRFFKYFYMKQTFGQLHEILVLAGPGIIK